MKKLKHRQSLSEHPDFRLPKPRKSLLLGTTLVLIFTFSSCGTSSSDYSGGGSNNPPVTTPPGEDTDQALQVARNAVVYTLESVLGLDSTKFRDDWIEEFAQGIKGYINTETPTWNDMMEATLQVYLRENNIVPHQMLLRAKALELATTLPLESVCGLRLIRDGSNPARYDVTTQEGTIFLYYGNNVDEAVAKLGEALEPYLHNRTGTSFEPLKPEAVAEIQRRFGEAFRSQIAGVPPGSERYVDKTEVHDDLLNAMSAIKK